MPPLFLGEFESSDRRFLIYEAIDAPGLDSFNTPGDAIWITRELKRIAEVLRKMKIVHNDIRPANILVLRAEQELRLIDYEFSDRDVIQPPPDKKTYSPLKPTSDPETRMLEELIPILQAGGEGRGTGSFAGDGRAVAEIIRMVMLERKPVWRVALHSLRQRLK